MTWIMRDTLVAMITLCYFIMVHEVGHAIVAWKDGAFRGLGTNGAIVWVRTAYGKKPPRMLYIMGPLASLTAWPLFAWNPHITTFSFLAMVLVFGLYDFLALGLYDRADENGCIEVKNKFLIESLRWMGFKEKVVQT
jgi:hypothetical protein